MISENEQEKEEIITTNSEKSKHSSSFLSETEPKEQASPTEEENKQTNPKQQRKRKLRKKKKRASSNLDSIQEEEAEEGVDENEEEASKDKKEEYDLDSDDIDLVNENLNEILSESDIDIDKEFNNTHQSGNDNEQNNEEHENQSKINKNIKNPTSFQQLNTSKADNIINCLPQESFINNSTSFESSNQVNDYHKTRFLSWNMVGSLTLKEEDDKTYFIELHHSDYKNKKKINFNEKGRISFGALSNIGIVVATQPEEEDMDKYEAEDKLNYSEIIFKPTGISSIYSDWRVHLQNYEYVDNLCIGIDWFAIYTDMRNIYIFSFSGIRKFVFTTSHQVICMAAYEGTLAYVYYNGPPLLGCQTLRFRLIDISNSYSEIYDGPICISSYSYLKWFSFSEEGGLYCLDSMYVLRYFSPNMGNSWIPLQTRLDEKIKKEEIQGYWVIGIESNEVYVVELKYGESEPTVIPKSKYSSYIISLLSDGLSNTDVKLFNDYVNIQFDKWRTNKYRHLKSIRQADTGEYYYSESVKSDFELNKLQIEHDKAIISIIKDCILESRTDKVLDYYDFLLNLKSKEQTVVLANKLDKPIIAEALWSKLEIDKKKEEEKGFSVPFSKEVVFKEKEKENRKENEKPKEVLSNIAIDLNRIRKIAMEEVEDEKFERKEVKEVKESNEEKEEKVKSKQVNPLDAFKQNKKGQVLSIFDDLGVKKSGVLVNNEGEVKNEVNFGKKRTFLG